MDSLKQAKFDQLQLNDVENTEEELGRGAYGVVTKVKVKGLICAGKKLHDALTQTSSANDPIVIRFMEECLKHAKLRHPNIVQLLGIHAVPNSYIPMLIMEYMPFSLASYVEQHSDIPMGIKYNILLDVSVGLRFLHEQEEPILHRDLTANNVMLTANLRAKISDLGQARIVTNTMQTMKLTTAPGTPCYMPPEALTSNPRYDVMMDVFSFGVLIIHTVMQEWPIPSSVYAVDQNDAGNLIPLTEVERRQSYFEKMEEDHPLTILAKKCVQNDPKLRPQLSVIVDNLASNTENEEDSTETATMIQHGNTRIASLETSLHEIKEQIDAVTREIQIKLSMDKAGISRIEKQLKSISSLVHSSLTDQHGKSEGNHLILVCQRGDRNVPMKCQSTDGKHTSLIKPPINIHFTGTHRGSILSGVVKTPMSIAVSNDGLVCVCDKEGWKAVHIYNPMSKKVESMVDSARPLLPQPPDEKCWYPSGIAVDQSGNILLSDTGSQRVLKFSPNGELLATAGKKYTRGHLDGEFNEPSGIAVARNADIFVCDKDNHRVQLFDSQLQFKGSFGNFGAKEEEFHHPRDVAFDSDGNIYIVDCSNYCIKVFSEDLRPLRQIGSEGNESHHFRAPMNICIDSEDLLHVTDRHKHCVMVFNTLGVFKMHYAYYGKASDGEFNHPMGIAADAQGHVYICDKLNKRVQVFM